MGWMVLESNTGEGKIFPHPFRLDLRSNQASLKYVYVLFPGKKGPGRGVDHQSPSNTEVKERVQLTSTLPLRLRGLF